MRHHWPILKTTLAAFAPLVLVSWIHQDAVVAIAFSWTSVTWLLAGLLYTQLIEYWIHRVPMHRGLPYLRNVRWNHLEHHRVFHGANFQTRVANDLQHIAGRYWVFPLLFVAHYAVLVFLLPAQAFILFFLGTVTHYVTFELTHWLTHIEDNAVDRFIARIPVLAGIRAYQIEHHRIHHETPELAFNFNPPYLGDRLTGHMPSLEEVPAAQPEPVAVVAMEPVVEAPFGWRRRFVRYGSAAAVGFAIIGAVVIAHGLLTHGKRPLETPEQIV